jgi:N-acylglucosamine 2-epimerase
VPATAITQYRQTYERELLERVLPFWTRHSPDPRHGGYFNCLDRDGTVYDTTKHVWLQGRQAWLLSALYCDWEQRPEWLDLARSGVAFLRQHAIRPDGRVFFSLAADGQPCYLQRKIFSECFYVMALAGYARAAERPALWREARAEFERVWHWADDWTQLGRPAYSGQAAAQTLAVPLILLNVLEVLAGDDPAAYAAEAEACIRRLQRHVGPQQSCPLETVAPDGSRLPGAEGRLINPGHAIEAGLFLQRWAQRLARPELSQQALAIVRDAFQTGWDSECGGLYYFWDAQGYSPTPLEWFMKLWWPHCEALHAHLLNYTITGESADWAAFERVHAYAFERFRDPACGEWFGYLDRQGNVTHRFKGGPFKGCFHLPRALWHCWCLLRQLES